MTKRAIMQTIAPNLQKLVLVLVTFVLMNDSDNKEFIFEKMSYIYYLLQFYKNEIQALFDSKNKVNTIGVTISKS